MPLTTKKIAHIAGKLTKIMAGRTQSITLVLKNGDGSTSTITKNAVWRPGADMDPSLDHYAAAVPGGPQSTGEDVLSMFLMSDITLTQLRAVMYGYPTTPLSSEPATRYVISSISQRGIVPGGDRWIVTWNRQR